MAAATDLDAAPWRGRPGVICVDQAAALACPSGLLSELGAVVRLSSSWQPCADASGLRLLGVIGAAGDGLRCPVLAAEEAGDPLCVASFVEAVCVLGRWRHLAGMPPRRGVLQAFHARHKYLLLARDPEGMRGLGRLLAGAAPGRLLRDYATELLRILRRGGSAGRHADAMSHMAGHLRNALSPASRRELAGLIEDCGRGLLPRSRALAVLRGHARAAGDPYLCAQFYLQGAPERLRPYIEQ